MSRFNKNARFIVAFGILMSTLILGACGSSDSEPTVVPQSNASEDGSSLEVWGINTGILSESKAWKFRQSVEGDDLQSANAADPALDDQDWQTVNLRWREFPGPAVANHFRKQFTLDEIGIELDQIEALQVSLQYDDTAVMYLNGVEVYRSIRGNLDPTFSTYPVSGNIPHDVEVDFGGFENFHVEIPNTNGTNTCESDANCDLSPYDGPNPPAIPVSLLQNGINTWAVTTWNRTAGGSGDSSLNHTFTILLDDTPVTTEPILINEVMASNDTTLEVELDGNLEYPDWIELYNSSDSPVNLQGWTISDSAASWEFPAISIPAFDYLVIAANDGDRRDTSPLQTNFRLSTEGDSLRLTDPNGFLADDYNVIPVQSVDVSYGRPNDDPAQAVNYLLSPTPGAMNSAVIGGTTPTLQLFVNKMYNLGESVSEQVDAFDADGDSVTYMLSPKPPGIDIDGDGLITGTAVTAGAFDSVISVTDSNNNSTTQQVSFIVLPAPETSPALVLNEYNAVSDDKELSGGSAIGNGGNWFEFVVVEDQLDLRGMILELYDNQGPDDQLRLASVLTFTNDERIASLPAGLIITISDQMPDDLSFNNNSDRHINFQVDGDGSGSFFVAVNGDFDSTHQGQTVLIKNAAGEIVSPLSGETAAWDEANGGVSSTEAMALCVNPMAGFALDVIESYEDIGTASSFGAENSCTDAGEDTFNQDLTPLRLATKVFPATSTFDNGSATEERVIGDMDLSGSETGLSKGGAVKIVGLPITNHAVNAANPNLLPIIESALFTIKSGHDDAEEHANSSVYIESSDLELSEDGSPQIIGLRFADIDIARNAVIESATIQFTADEIGSGNSDLEIAVQTNDNATAFSEDSGNISNRATSDTVRWSPANWNSVGAQTASQRTPELGKLVQQIVDRNNWKSGNAIAFIITGSGVRTVTSYEGNNNYAAVLNIKYRFDGNQAPVARILAEPAIGDYPLTVYFDALESSDDGHIESYDWAFGDGQFRSEGPVSPAITYQNPGTYTVALTVTDETGKSSDASIEIIVTDPDALASPETIVSEITSGADDVEQRADSTR